MQKAESAEIAQSHPSHKIRSKVITDLGLEHPYQVSRLSGLRSESSVQPATIVISGFYDDLAAWTQHGADVALPKPTDTEELLKTIDRLLPH